MIRILVDSVDPRTRCFLMSQLPRDRFELEAVESTRDFIETARRQCPQIAILDRIHEGRDVAEMKIAVLKDVQPDVRVIAVSEDPSANDASVLELGVFYYMTTPVGDELIRVIEAAADAVSLSMSDRLRHH